MRKIGRTTTKPKQSYTFVYKLGNAFAWLDKITLGKATPLMQLDLWQLKDSFR